MSTPTLTAPASRTVGTLVVTPFPHPQGCRSYLVADPATRQAMAIDPHLDSVAAIAQVVRAEGLTLPHVVDTHTHADHPSGSAALAAQFSSTRIAHPKAGHAGVTRHPADGDELHLGDTRITVRHAPGHTPDHIVLLAEGAIFAGDTLLIGGVARTDFLGGDAGQLFDTLRDLLSTLPDETVLFPGHDYEGRVSSTIGQEKRDNPWLRMKDRAAFVQALTANPPPRPANMDDLLELNKNGVNLPARVTAQRAIALAAAGGAGSIVDVRTALEAAAESIPGSRHVPLDDILARADEIRATAAPRLLLCRTGPRAERAREALERAGVTGLQVIEGGLEAWRAAGGELRRTSQVMSLERQVRVAAGAMGLAGTLLALLHPAFLIIPGFVGAGLVFAGLTDRCGMALVLAKMPWNARAITASGGMAAGGSCAANLPPAAGGTCAASAPPATGGTCAASAPPAAD